MTKRDQPRKPTRLSNFDYTKHGAYFVTLCTQNRVCLFGDVVENNMQLHDAGTMILDWWHKLPTKYPNVKIDQFVVMPDHIHGIIFINNTSKVPAVSLPTLMQWFKTMTTNAYIRGVKTHGWETFPRKLWQRSYYDHIIRNDGDLNTRRQYILTNPSRWVEKSNE